MKEGSIKAGEIAFKNDDSYQLPQDPGMYALSYVLHALTSHTHSPDSDEDKRAAKRHFDFYIGIFSQPVYGDGNYPQTVRETISERLLPELTAAEKEQIK